MFKENTDKILRWVLLISWMIFIFIMSNEPAKISDEHSTFVVRALQYSGIKLDSFLGELANFAIRKLAHFTEYMILFFLAYSLLRTYLDKKDACIFALLIVVSYACTDEIHQLFIPGRSGKLKDVLIDTSGGTAGLIIVQLGIWIKKHIKNR